MKDDSVYLRHILDAIGKIESYVAVGRDEFMSASHWQDAVIRQLAIVGEATKNLSQNLRVIPMFPGGASLGCATSWFTIIWGSASQQCGKSLRPTCQP